MSVLDAIQPSTRGNSWAIHNAGPVDNGDLCPQHLARNYILAYLHGSRFNSSITVIGNTVSPWS